jgi:hypothetical protein
VMVEFDPALPRSVLCILCLSLDAHTLTKSS